jgi:hypothetical protein
MDATYAFVADPSSPFSAIVIPAKAGTRRRA